MRERRVTMSRDFLAWLGIMLCLALGVALAQWDRPARATLPAALRLVK